MPGIDERLVVAHARFGKHLDSRLTEHVSAAGFTLTQFTVLELLLHKGPSTVNQIIQGVLSTSGNIGMVIDNLMKAKLVSKTIHPDDSRSRLISLTENGRKKIKLYYPSHKKELQKCFKGMAYEDKEKLVKLLIEARKHMDGKNIRFKGGQERETRKS